MEEITVLPKRWEFLSETDQNEYLRLKAALSDPSCKNRRNRSAQTFGDVVNSIKEYVYKSKEDECKRSFVCGICWLDNGIAINVRQLKLLVSKCKSSINGSFHTLGYEIVPPGAESVTSLISVFPFLKQNFSELRQWTIRHIQKVNEEAEQ